MDPISIALVVGPPAIVAATDIVRRVRQWRSGSSTPASSVSAPAASPTSPTSAAPRTLPLPAQPATPAEWAQYAGARPELAGSPDGSILAIPGLAELGPAFRAGLVEVARRTSVPVDSLAIVLRHESGLNPAALNPLPAAGLFQLTTGAHLEGFETAEQVRQVAKLSAEQQLPILEALLRKNPATKAATPGRLLMLNFLPAFASRGDDFELAAKGSTETLPGTSLTKGQIYSANPGFDKAGRGRYTVADVKISAANAARAARGARILVNGDRLVPQEAPASPPVAPPSSGTTPGPQPTQVQPQFPSVTTTAANKSAMGLLLSAVRRGEHTPPTFTKVLVDKYYVFVSNDALIAPVDGRALRLPVTYDETVEICKRLGCVAPTQPISDALWRAATIRVTPIPLPATERMATLEWSLRHNDNVDAQIKGRKGLAADVGKDWIIHPRLVEKGAVNYGWRLASGKPLQSVGGVHNAQHADYSQVLRLVQRRVLTVSGESLDILDVLQKEMPSISKYLDAYR